MTWNVKYILLIIISTLVDYFSALEIFRSRDVFRKRLFLFLSLFVNLGLLFVFKYFNFFSDSFVSFFRSFSIPLNPLLLKVLLPVGISFYTFQTLSYTVDVYRGKIIPERHLGIFAVYVSFFPQLVAGPIERAKNLLPQFYDVQVFDYIRVTNGLKLMLWGFFKKIVIADRLSVVVNTVFNDPTSFSGFPLILATVFFAFQIYCDFSGYSDIAIGASQVLGIKLMDNFRRPYFSRSISEFWNRWHISLSSWFRDYLFVPILNKKLTRRRIYFASMVVFLVSGLWHGANWTFVVWGGLHGLYLVLGIFTSDFRKKVRSFLKLDHFPRIHMFLQVFFTFVLVNIGWIFFRANSLSDAIYILTHLFSNFSFVLPETYIGAGWVGIFYAFAIIGFMEFIHIIQEHVQMRKFISDKPFILRWSIYLFLIVFLLLFGVFNQTEFIYFQF